MPTTLNKILIFVMFLAVLMAFSITGRGQESNVMMEYGFSLTTTVTSGGFVGGKPVWLLGKDLGFIAGDSSIHNRLKGLEGREVVVIVTPSVK
jgi:hypothetical protein